MPEPQSLLSLDAPSGPSLEASFRGFTFDWGSYNALTGASYRLV